MKDSHTTTFIVDTPDYFAAHTNNGELRFGLVGVAAIQIPADHAAAESVLASTTSDDVEAIFDDFMDAKGRADGWLALW